MRICTDVDTGTAGETSADMAAMADLDLAPAAEAAAARREEAKEAMANTEDKAVTAAREAMEAREAMGAREAMAAREGKEGSADSRTKTTGSDKKSIVCSLVTTRMGPEAWKNPSSGPAWENCARNCKSLPPRATTSSSRSPRRSIQTTTDALVR